MTHCQDGLTYQTHLWTHDDFFITRLFHTSNLKDMANNLNRKKQGFRWSSNSLAFSQAIKMYGGRRMCDLFSLNFGGPNYSFTKRVNQKGVQFVPGEHVDIFRSVAQIYKQAKETYGILGPIPVILAEDETKVKGRIAWDHRWDTLEGFCGPKDDHICDSNYNVVVGMGDFCYNNIVDSFRTNRVGVFARIIIMNPSILVCLDLHLLLFALAIALIHRGRVNSGKRLKNYGERSARA